MGTNTLNNRSAGQTIIDAFFNDIHQAMNTDLVGRNSTGVPTAGQNLGTVAFPWGTIRGDTLVLNGNPVDTSQISSPPNRVISGKHRSSSNQPAFITPSGAGASFDLKALSVHLELDVNGASVSVTTDITKTGLTTAPASNNTALVNDTEAAAQEDTRLWGEYGHRKSITIDTVGSNITALVGKYAAFKLVGSATEYMLAFVESTTKLSKIFRGYFYDPSLNPIKRTKFSNNDTLTLMSLGWVFVENDGTTVDISYTNPTWDFTSPGSPVTGDYWYDEQNQVWKRYDGAAFQIINRTLVGNVILDTTNCVGARCQDFFANYKADNKMELELESTEIVRSTGSEGAVNVAGRDFDFNNTLTRWNITTNLAGSADMYNASEQASTLYYLYLTDLGQKVISDITPYWRPDLKGWYSPYNPWRMVGIAYNNGSSDLEGANAENQTAAVRMYDSSAGNGAVATAVRQFATIVTDGAALGGFSDSNAGGSITCRFPCMASVHYGDSFTTDGSSQGLSLNATDLTSGATAGNKLEYLTAAGTRNTQGVFASSAVMLKIGDTLRAQSGASGTTNADSYGRLFAIKVSNRSF